MPEGDLASRAERLLAEAYDPRFCYCPLCPNRHRRQGGPPPPALVNTRNTVPDPPNGHGAHACPECGFEHLRPFSSSEPLDKRI